MRICSLLPSATEIVHVLGLGDQLVGVTHECDHPPGVERLPHATRSVIEPPPETSREIHAHVSLSIDGGSSIYTLDRSILADLEPDLILTQELCDVCAVSYGEVQRAVRELSGQTTVLSLEPHSLEEIVGTIERVGEVCGVVERAGIVASRLRERIESVTTTARRVSRRPRVLALEWFDPPFIGGHWVPEMIRRAGGEDVLGEEGSKSVEVTWARIVEAAPEVVLLIPCGYDQSEVLERLPELRVRSEWNDLPAVQAGAVHALDATSFFSRPGPRVVDGLEMIGEILHPDLFPRRYPESAWRLLTPEERES